MSYILPVIYKHTSTDVQVELTTSPTTICSLTVPSTGVYKVQANAGVHSGSAGGKVPVQLEIKKNGVTLAYVRETVYSVSDDDYVHLALVYATECNTGDVLSVTILSLWNSAVYFSPPDSPVNIQLIQNGVIA